MKRMIVMFFGVMPFVLFAQATADSVRRDKPGQAVADSVSAKHLLEEVVVSTGIQTLPKERSTGAYALVDNVLFNQQVGTDVLSRLEAVAVGLNVDRLSQDNDLGIRIRGQSTLSGGTMKDPLIILDNFPYTGSLDAINPNDVESVTLLKDAAAASIWGARAANGVIVITTKRARAGAPLRVDFNANATVGCKPDLHAQRLMAMSEYIDVERFLFRQGHRFDDTASYLHPAFSPVYEVLFRQRRGELSAGEADALIMDLGRTEVRDQYLQHVYRASLQQQYALNVQGSSARATWLVSAGYDRGRTELDATSNRLTFNVRNTYSPLEAIRIETGLRYTQSDGSGGRTGYTNGRLLPYAALADATGKALAVDLLQYPGTYRRPFIDTLGGGRLLDWRYYPLTDDDHRSNRTDASLMLLDAAMNYRPLPWLAADLKYQYGMERTRGEYLKREGSYEARDLINRFTGFNTAGDPVYVVPNGGIVDFADGRMRTHNLRGQLNGNQAWGYSDVHAMLGMEVSDRTDDSRTKRMYGYNADILSFTQVDYLNRYNQLVEGYGSFIPQNDQLDGRVSRFVSTFFNAGYTYRSRYALTVSGRRDASNLFGVDLNDRWNWLWSVGGSWEASREPFYRADWMPYLRLRATYGYSGNTDQSRSALTAILYSGTSNFMNVPMAFIMQDANPALKWERIRMVNLAVDFRAMSDRLSGSVDVFFKRGTDLFGPDPIDYTTGISGTVTRNISELAGRGIDAQLSSRNIVRNNFSWQTDLNLSWYDDKVVRYYRTNLRPSLYVRLSEGGSTYIEGTRLYALYAHRWAGLDPQTGDPQGYLNGEVSKNYDEIRGTGATMDDLVDMGSSRPLVFGALINTITYGKVGLNFNLLYKLGYSVREQGLDYSSLFQGIRGFGEYARRWQQPGDEAHTDVPAMVYPANSQRDMLYLLSEVKVKRGDHIRLQYVNVFYNLKMCQVYLNAANLGVVWKRDDVAHDPMYSNSAIAPPPTYSLGIRFSL